MRLIIQVCLALVMTLSLTFSVQAAKYAEGQVANGGTIQGIVTYNGTVKMRTVLPTKDKEVCGKARKVPNVIVGAGGAVQDSVVVLKDIATGKPWPAMQTPVINNVDCIFEPHVQITKRGKVDIINSDPVLHNTHGYYGKATAFNVALPFENAKVTKTLKRVGEVRTDCDAHGWMLGWLYVVSNPYFEQTGADGMFTLSDVPPGNYTLIVWQEAFGEKEVSVSVKAGATTEVSIELGS